METKNNHKGTTGTPADPKDEGVAGTDPGFSWKKRGWSFGYAFKGVKYAFTTQHNMWLHGLAAVLAVLLGFVFHITQIQWLIILLCIGAVMSLEIINTAIEVLADHLHPEQHPAIGLVKDLAAGAVLIAAVISGIIGCLIFWQPLWTFLH